MRTLGLNVGGEQSGHIVLGDFATTGDGLIAALQCLAVIVEAARPVSEVGRVFVPLPQTLRNVALNGTSRPPLEDASVRAVIRDGEGRLSGRGRLVIRESGTEPVIRVMAEGEDSALVNEVVDDITRALARAAG